MSVSAGPAATSPDPRRPIDSLVPEPTTRKLRIFAFDPSLAAQYDTAGIGHITIDVPWENLTPGPVGEYIEVVDADPASESFYRPVDLNDPRVLAQNGVPPAEDNPLFHQQMVYAVAMATIGNFERALGRSALWRTWTRRVQGKYKEQFVRRLRLYPHALRDRNAYYHPEKTAILFGYFPTTVRDASNTPGTIVFTCLSHDIVAHETTHALLDGVHPRFNEPFNVDVLAFHEAFADIVAMFQRFAYPGVLRDQVARTRGDLGAENLLGQLAQQFGRASGRGTALRDALGEIDKATGEWRPRKPDVRALDGLAEPHARGAILVAAVFTAFLKIYRARTVDLYRIASDGTGVLRQGEIHPDLTKRLADEAERIAALVLQMCIRAIDYCPPVGVTFGDYLRAIITADNDLNPDDNLNRLAFKESFQQWGIQTSSRPSGVSVESLLWPSGDDALRQYLEDEQEKALRKTRARGLQHSKRRREGIEGAITAAQTQFEKLFTGGWTTHNADFTFEGESVDVSFAHEGAAEAEDVEVLPNEALRAASETDRHLQWKIADQQAGVFWNWFLDKNSHQLAAAWGIVMDATKAPLGIYRSRSSPQFLRVEIHSVRTATRRGRQGWAVPVLVVEITQRRRAYFDLDAQEAADKRGEFGRPSYGDFNYRTGCTLLIDPRSYHVRRVIRTRGTIVDDVELNRVRDFLTGGGMEAPNAFTRARDIVNSHNPFALLHRDDGG